MRAILYNLCRKIKSLKIKFSTAFVDPLRQKILNQSFGKRNMLASLLCLYEQDSDLVRKYIDSLMLHPLSEGFDQFKKDYDYYYSRILNVPMVPPSVLQFDFMRRCQLQCRICKIWSNQATRPEGELTYEELKEIFDQAAEMKIPQCYFSGGEPFMLEYFFDILAYAKSKGIFIEVTTNGLLLSEENSRRLIEIPLDQINVSIDGAHPETHDYHRNCPGLFDKVIDNVRRLSQLKKTAGSSFPIITMAFVVTNKNFHEMLDYVKLAQTIGAVAFFQPYCSHNDNYYHKKTVDEFVIPEDRLDVFHHEVDRLIAYSIECASDPPIISNSVYSLENLKKYSSGTLATADYCFAGFNRMTVLEDRQVGICPGQIGDLKYGRLKEIWSSPQADMMRKKILKCSKPCLLGSAYQPGPSVNDVFLITRRYLHYLERMHICTRSALDRIISCLEDYKTVLIEHKSHWEGIKLSLLLRYLDDIRSNIDESQGNG